MKKYLCAAVALALIAGAFFYASLRMRRDLAEIHAAIQEMEQAQSETDEQIQKIELSQKEFRRAVLQAEKAAKEGAVTIREDIKKQVVLISDDAIGRAIDAELAIFESRSLGEDICGVGSD